MHPASPDGHIAAALYDLRRWTRVHVRVSLSGIATFRRVGDPSGYEDLADLIRNKIATGEWLAGQQIPSEKDLGAIYGLGRTTVRRAMRLLRSEGLIEVRHGYGSRVRESAEVEDVPLPTGVRFTARNPTPRERQALGIPEGVPVLVSPDLLGEDGQPRLWPAHQFRFVT